MYSRETCLREIEKAPIKTGWADTDKGQSGKPKEFQTHARPELYVSTPPLEDLKVLLSEENTGKLGGKVVALVDARRTYFYAPSRRRVFVELSSESVRQMTNTCADCCDTACTTRVTPHKIGRNSLHRQSATSS